MRVFVRLLLLLLVPLAVAAQNADTMWVNVYDRGSCQDDYYANDIVRDPNGNLYVVGSMGITMGPYLRLTPGIIKYNQWGDSLWAYVWHPGISALALENTFHAVALDSSGHVWGAGTRMHYINPAFTYSFFVARLDTANPENNQKVRIMNWGFGDDRLFDIAVGPGGEVYVCGACTDTMTTHSPPRLDTFDFFTVMRLHVTDSIRPLWTRRYVLDEDAFDVHGGLGPRLAARGRDRHPVFFNEQWYEWTNAAVALDVNSAGELAVTGYGLHSSREYQAWTMKFDSTGNRLWEKADGGSLLDEDDAGFDVAMMENGRVVICGFDDRGLYPDFAVYGYPAAGGDAYAKVQVDYNMGDDYAFAIAKDDATPQNVYVTGAAEMPAGLSDWGYQFLTHKLEVTNLEQRWGSGGATWGDTLEDAFGYDVAWADGRVYVTGHDSGAVMMTLCYSDSSVSPKFEEWALAYAYPDSSDNSLGTAVCASDSDGVFVAGQSERINPFLGSVMPVMRLFNDDRDFRADSLLAPNDTLVYGAAVAPRMRIVNEGNSRGLPVAYFRAGDGFADTVIVLNWMYPGDSLDVTFANWTPAQMGPVAVRCSVALLGDVDHSNDVIHDTVFVLRRDVGAVAIVAPPSVVDSGAPLTPQAQVFNSGNLEETFDCWLSIGPAYRETAYAVTVPAGSSGLVEFPNWTPRARGTWTVACSTMLAGDMNSQNDSALSLVTVRVVDVGAVSVAVPSGNYEPNDTIVPEATWRNNGTQLANFDAWMILEDPAFDARVYAERIQVVALAAGAETTLHQFPAHTLVNYGYWNCRCSTGVQNDIVPANDVIDQGFIVGGNPDVGLAAILAPVGTVDTAQALVPRVRVGNHGDVRFPFKAHFTITDWTNAQVYRDSVSVPGIPVGGDSVLRFPEWEGTTVAGDHVARCSLAVADDDPANDTISGGFTVAGLISWPGGWVEMLPMPREPSGRPVKRGGWLTTLGGLIYAGKGYRTQDFYRYDPLEDTWQALGPLPFGDRSGRQREAKRGSRGVGDGAEHIYYTAGNNTLTFAKYFASLDTWVLLPDVPEGPYRKPVKGGNDLVYVVVNDTGWVYLMKGYKTEFYRFNTLTNEWDTLAHVPAYREKVKYGSWLVHDGGDNLYAHGANYYNRAASEHYLYKYDIPGDSWYSENLHGMPLMGLHSGRVKKKKSKDGGSAAWYDGDIYALKGGNTQQFWKYAPEKDSWTELDTVPNYSPNTGRKRRVKYGADIVEAYNALWALKGNKTFEFWRYGFGSGALFASRPERSGAAGHRTAAGAAQFSVAPNPLTGSGVLRYVLPRTARLDAALIDAAGRRVRTVASGRLVSGSGAIPLDTRGLARGVYLLRLSAPGFEPRSLKLVIE